MRTSSPASTSASAALSAPAPSTSSSAGDERQLVGGGAQVADADLGVRRVEDRRLVRAAEQGVGVVDEVAVERVGARHEQREALAAAAGAAPLLAQARDRAREADRDRAVEQADVDAQLERLGRDDAEQLPGHEVALDAPPLLGGVARAVRREALGDVVAPGRRSRLSRAKRNTSSLALRLLTKQIVRSPRAVSAASSPAASPSADPRVPSASSSSGVSQNATRRGARGAPSPSTTRTSRPVSAAQASAGFAIVALASRNCGSLP